MNIADALISALEDTIALLKEDCRNIKQPLPCRSRRLKEKRCGRPTGWSARFSKALSSVSDTLQSASGEQIQYETNDNNGTNEIFPILSYVSFLSFVSHARISGRRAKLSVPANGHCHRRIRRC
jgi:hypothetical protein